jgi:hypothetical protein
MLSVGHLADGPHAAGGEAARDDSHPGSDTRPGRYLVPRRRTTAMRRFRGIVKLTFPLTQLPSRMPYSPREHTTHTQPAYVPSFPVTTPARAVWHLLIQVRGYVATAWYEPSWREESTMARRARTTPETPSNEIELTQRDCLRCDRVFPSKGPYNRLCKTCLESLNASPTPDEEYSIGYQ